MMIDGQRRIAPLSHSERASGRKGKKAAVFGGGIAGLTVAHELSRRGWTVTVYEVNDEVGGFCRSIRLARHDDMPSEYSWHGFGPWYHNVFDLVKQIPSDGGGTVYDKALSRPIDFGVAPDDGPAVFDGTGILSFRHMFHMTSLDLARWVWLTLKTWTANRRSFAAYSRISGDEAYRSVLSDVAWRLWRACFGPWIGSDWTNVSLHQVGLFFRKQLFSKPTHHHPADAKGPAWSQGARSGWLVLRGPSSEVWFDPWVAELERHGVRFRYGVALGRFDLEDGRISRASLSTGEPVEADLYVLATDPFSAADVVAQTPALAALDEFRCLRPLVQDGPHTQVSFRLAFGERIRWPRARTGLVIADSEFNLTMFAQEQTWRPDVDLGDGVASLWTGTACVSNVPGRLYGLPLENCTKEQFVEEVKAQLASCRGLDALVREANGGRGWTSFPIVRLEVWHEWIFSPDGIRNRQPKWVNTTHTQPYLPEQRTPVANLVLAGAHTRTFADVWSIEAAVESGRRAARVVEPDVPVIPEYVPWALRAARAVDDACFTVGLPHALELLLVGLPVTLVAASIARHRSGRAVRVLPPASLRWSSGGALAAFLAGALVLSGQRHPSRRRASRTARRGGQRRAHGGAHAR